MTPPAPVALPPYGSMALGWLCVSTLKQTASVSSNATTPALSLKTERQNGPPTSAPSLARRPSISSIVLAKIVSLIRLS